MLEKAPRMTRAHYNFIADMLGPKVAWPSQLLDIADHLAATNPAFNRQKFLDRAVNAWEKHNPPEEINDEIRF